MRRVAFLGPSRPADPRFCAGIEVRQPARHGDLHALELTAGDAVLIVDGVYQQVAPLRHKEILTALDAGVKVIGAGSIGALRAAELKEYGAIGVGEVFEAFVSGRYVDDADVSLLHADDYHATPLTRARVSIDSAADKLKRRGLLTSADADLIGCIAAGIHFTERTDWALRSLAERRSLANVMSQVLDEVDRADVKRSDAAAGCVRLRAQGEGVHVPTSPLPNTSARSVYDARARLEFASWSGTDVTGSEVLSTLQIVLVDFAERHRRYVKRLSKHEQTDSWWESNFNASPQLSAWSPSSAAWSRGERALVRAFRLPPGNIVYETVPVEIHKGLAVSEIVDVVRSLRGNGDESTATPDQLAQTIGRLWHCRDAESFEAESLDRGFMSVAEVLRAARGLSLGALNRLAAVNEKG